MKMTFFKKKKKDVFFFLLQSPFFDLHPHGVELMQSSHLKEKDSKEPFDHMDMESSLTRP